jgi:hypothetical protein
MEGGRAANANGWDADGRKKNGALASASTRPATAGIFTVNYGYASSKHRFPSTSWDN